MKSFTTSLRFCESVSKHIGPAKARLALMEITPLLMKLMIRNQQGQLTLTCPTCRQATPVPTNGVAGLQSAFQVNHLLEILEEHKKAKDTTASQEGAKTIVTHTILSKKVITNCFEYVKKERELYCKPCGDLICFKCVAKWGKHQNHDYHTLDEAFEIYKREVANSIT